MKTVKYILILLQIIICSQIILGQENNFVNKKIVKLIDITGDGINDEIILQLNSVAWEKPINWSLTINSLGKQIFYHNANDARIDTFFNDIGYVSNKCSTYLECKKEYYLKEIMNRIVVKTDLAPNDHVFDKANEGSIYFVAKKELIQKYYLSEYNARNIIRKIIKRIKTKSADILFVPISPVEDEYPRIYVEQVKGFVTIYEW